MGDSLYYNCSDDRGVPTKDWELWMTVGVAGVLMIGLYRPRTESSEMAFSKLTPSSSFAVRLKVTLTLVIITAETITLVSLGFVLASGSECGLSESA